MSGLAAGSLDRRVTLHRFRIVTDGYGDPQDGYAALATVWASVRATPGRERLASAQTAAEAPTIIVIRWSRAVSDLNPKDLVEYPAGSGRLFDIKSVVEIGHREGLEIAATGRAS